MSERFELHERLGRGAMGEVRRATDTATGRTVAVKLMHAQFVEDPTYLARFEREVELARRIQSPHVVRVEGYGVREGIPYLVMEYVDGPTLRGRLESIAPVEWPEARRILAQLASGLAAVHSAGVVHRDLKPSNVLVAPDGTMKLSDFGIAGAADLTKLTGSSAILGTPAYLPPEGTKNERSDLYALGVIAFELLTGVPPFEGTTPQQVILGHLRTPPDLERLPEEARPLVGGLLAKDPTQRPAAADEVLAQLLPSIAGQAFVPAASVSTQALVAPAAAAPPVAAVIEEVTLERVALGGARTDRTARRNRTPLLGAAGVVVIVAAVTAIALLGRTPGRGTAPADPLAGESFAGGGITGSWHVVSDGAGLPCLTAATTEVATANWVLAACPGARDRDGSGALRLTDGERSGDPVAIESTAERLTAEGLDIRFALAQYAGDGDGASLYLRDASKDPGAGIGDGGSGLGYDRMEGGLLAVGFDQFGWFTNGCTSGVSVHAGASQDYAPLGCAEGGDRVMTVDHDGSTPPETPVDRADGTRWVRIVVDPTTSREPLVRVYLSTTGPDALALVLTAPVSDAYRAASGFRFGFSAATGAAKMTNEVWDVSWGPASAVPDPEARAGAPITSPEAREPAAASMPPSTGPAADAPTPPPVGSRRWNDSLAEVKFSYDTWYVLSNGEGLPCLTVAGADVPVANGRVASCPGATDANGAGALHLSDFADPRPPSGIEFGEAFPRTDGLDISFQYAQIGTDGALVGDGMAFYLRDGAIAPGSPLSGGGSDLGYERMEGALLGVGIDPWGGFSEECGKSISVKGGADEDFRVLGCAKDLLVTTGPKRAAQTRWLRVIVDPAGMSSPRIRVYYSTTGPDDLREVLDAPVSNSYLRATSFRFGFSAATGLATMDNDIWGVSWGPSAR